MSLIILYNGMIDVQFCNSLMIEAYTFHCTLAGAISTVSKINERAFAIVGLYFNNLHVLIVHIWNYYLVLGSNK